MGGRSILLSRKDRCSAVPTPTWLSIDFDEEIKKFQPILEVEDAEDAIYNKDIPDITDVLGKIMAEASDSNSNKKNK